MQNITYVVFNAVYLFSTADKDGIRWFLRFEKWTYVDMSSLKIFTWYWIPMWEVAGVKYGIGFPQALRAERWIGEKLTALLAELAEKNTSPRPPPPLGMHIGVWLKAKMSNLIDRYKDTLAYWFSLVAGSEIIHHYYIPK